MGLVYSMTYRGLTILKYRVHHIKFLDFIFDILFTVAFFINLYMLLGIRNSGELRCYIIFGLVIGSLIYFLMLSKIFEPILIYIVDTLKGMFKKIKKIIVNCKNKMKNKR